MIDSVGTSGLASGSLGNGRRSGCRRRRDGLLGRSRRFGRPGGGVLLEGGSDHPVVLAEGEPKGGDVLSQFGDLGIARVEGLVDVISPVTEQSAPQGGTLRGAGAHGELTTTVVDALRPAHGSSIGRVAASVPPNPGPVGSRAAPPRAALERSMWPGMANPVMSREKARSGLRAGRLLVPCRPAGQRHRTPARRTAA